MKQKKSRFYCTVRARNGEQAMLISRCSTKEAARKEMYDTYKVISVLDISDTFTGVCETPNYYGNSLTAYNSQFHSGNRTTKRGHK